MPMAEWGGEPGVLIAQGGEGAEADEEEDGERRGEGCREEAGEVAEGTIGVAEVWGCSSAARASCASTAATGGRASLHVAQSTVAQSGARQQ